MSFVNLGDAVIKREDSDVDDKEGKIAAAQREKAAKQKPRRFAGIELE